jgi:hypothetical protein
LIDFTSGPALVPKSSSYKQICVTSLNRQLVPAKAAMSAAVRAFNLEKYPKCPPCLTR